MLMHNPRKSWICLQIFVRILRKSEQRTRSPRRRSSRDHRLRSNRRWCPAVAGCKGTTGLRRNQSISFLALICTLHTSTYAPNGQKLHRARREAILSQTISLFLLNNRYSSGIIRDENSVNKENLEIVIDPERIERVEGRNVAFN